MDQKVVSKKIGGSTAVGIGVVAVWFLGYMGVSMSAEIGTVVGAMALAAWTNVWEMGLLGVLHRILRGDDRAGG